jgi:glucose/arabinose dehydrogenase
MALTKPIQSIVMALLAVAFCSSASNTTPIMSNSGARLIVEPLVEFNEPWAMTFLPDGRLLVTEKSGQLFLTEIAPDRSNTTSTSVLGVPSVAYGGQGGLGDVIIHPQFSNNNWIYLSYAETGESGKQGAAVIRAELDLSSNPRLVNTKVIWRQFPKVTGEGHYSHRLAFAPDGKLFITSGDRQKQIPAQDFNQDLGKVIRLNDDGTVPLDNPYQQHGQLAKTFWSVGHRNLLGIAFDAKGQLWTHEMGPRHGDEFNLTLRGENYGWPVVSWGNHYSGASIPDHDTRSDFHSPETYWVPTIAPSGMIIYSGGMFSNWQGSALIGGLRSEALIRINITDNQAKEVERFDMKQRIREVEQGPDGAIWVLEDGSKGRLLALKPYH